MITISLSAQDMIYVISQYQVPRKDMSSFLELYDNYYGDVEFKSGGVIVDWIRIGNGDFNLRVGRYGDMNNWGGWKQRCPNMKVQIFGLEQANILQNMDQDMQGPLPPNKAMEVNITPDKNGI